MITYARLAKQGCDLILAGRNPARLNALSTRSKGHVSSTLCAVAFLLWTNPGSSVDLEIDANSFRCITKMTPVRQFYVDNLRGNLDATLAAANSATGAVYPPGSVIQLIPGEAMVKRDKGFNPATRPIPVTRAMIAALQGTDPRWQNPAP